MAKDGSIDYKSFYFTSLVHLLSDSSLSSSAHHSQARSKSAVIPHSKKPQSRKRYELDLQSDQEQYKSRPLPVDPIFLSHKKEWGRKSLAHNTRSQLSYDKNVEEYEREKRKAVNRLQNSKSYHTKMLNQMRERQMEICRNREKEEILKQAQHRYDKAPILETQRFCGACARRPKSAKAGSQVTVDGLLRPPQQIQKKSHAHRLTFSTYEQRSTPPKPLLSRRRSKSAIPSVSFTESSHDSSSLDTDDSRSCSVPSPVEGETEGNTFLRPVSPLRKYDSSIIPDHRLTVSTRPKTSKCRVRLVASAVS